MRRKKSFVVLAAAGALGLASAVAAKDLGDRPHEGGAVTPCSLDGINPANHREIFDNPAIAASYGFVRSADGTWHVRPGCRR